MWQLMIRRLHHQQPDVETFKTLDEMLPTLLALLQANNDVQQLSINKPPPVTLPGAAG